MKQKIKLGVNIDHIATIRQARREGVPDLISAARQVIAAGADSIVAHLREDRRHIQDEDIRAIRKLSVHFDLEMAATAEMLGIALDVNPDMATIVPEKRQELTTEGGLDAAANVGKLKRFVSRLEKAGIRVSLFVDPVAGQIEASSKAGASFIEIHTGKYARAPSKKNFEDIAGAVKLAKSLGLRVNAGHGLDYNNVKPIVRLDGVEELNIGFSIIARSVFVGLKKAVAEMKKLLILLLAMSIFSGHLYAATLEAVSTPEVMVFATVEAPLEAATVEVNTGPITAETATKGVSREIMPDWFKELEGSEEAAAGPKLPEKQIFSDVPEDHWAASSVNRLVKMGVTRGYPDGTFRGANNLSRYETAVFLSKMAHAREVKAAVNEKIMEELASEVHKIRYTLDMYKKPPAVKRPIYGTFSARLRLANLVSANAASSIVKASLGPVFDYRLITGYKHEFGDGSFVRLGIDTMDSSLTGGRDLAREMLEAEAAARNGSGFGVSITAGPGLVVHREGPSNIFPSDDFTVYLRQNNGIKFYYDPGNFDAGAGYSSTSIASSGASGVNDIYGYVGYKFRDTFLGDIGLKYSIDNFVNDLRATYSTAESYISMCEIAVAPSRNMEFNIRAAASASQNTPHNAFVGLSLLIKEYFRSGSASRLYASKIGSEFLDYPTYPGMLGTNIFDKLYQAGTYDIGLEISQVISSGLSVRMSSGLVTGPNGQYGKEEPKSNATFELGMDFGLIDNAVMTVVYRTYQSPSAIANATSDSLGLGLKYVY